MRNNSSQRKGPPRGGSRNAPGRGGRRNFDPDYQFKKEIRQDIMAFLVGEDDRLDLPPFNSYQRKIAHDLAKEYRLESSSEGEGAERHNVFLRTENSYKPSQEEIEDSFNKDHGDQEFFVASGANGTEIALFEDGSFGLHRGEPKETVLDKKLIVSGAFKIKNNRIVDFTDPEW